MRAIRLFSRRTSLVEPDHKVVDESVIRLSLTSPREAPSQSMIARMRGFCHDGGPTGSSSEGLVRYTWVRNTIYDCGSVWNSGGFGGNYGLLSRGPASAGASNTLSRNLLTSLDLGTSSQFASSDHNLIKNGDRPGTTDRRFKPRFADHVDYRPTNLPPGYENVGYRRAPAGHTAAP